MGNRTANRKAPSESLTSMQRNGAKSPLMNWMEMNRQPETAPTGRFRLKFPSLAPRIRFISVGRVIFFLRSHTRAIGTGIVVVAILAVLFVFRSDRSANMQLENSEIHFDDITIHPLNESSALTTGWSTQNENDSPNHSGAHSSVSVVESHTEIFPVQPDAFTIQKLSDGKHGAWLTGTIEVDETSLSRARQSRNRIGQRIEYFGRNRD